MGMTTPPTPKALHLQHALSPDWPGDTHRSAAIDVHESYRRVAEGFDTAVQGLTEEMWHAQTPCDQWNARDLVAHVVDNHRSVIARVMGREPAPSTGDLRQEWSHRSRTVRKITCDPAALAKEIEGPAGNMAAGEVIGRFLVIDLLVHTWDLARTVGADEHLNPSAVRYAYEILKPMDAHIRAPYLYGPKIDPPPGSDIQTELLYFLGRRA